MTLYSLWLCVLTTSIVFLGLRLYQIDMRTCDDGGLAKRVDSLSSAVAEHGKAIRTALGLNDRLVGNRTDRNLMAEFEKIVSTYSMQEMNCSKVQVFLIANYDDFTDIERERIHFYLRTHKADIAVPINDKSAVTDGSYR